MSVGDARVVAAPPPRWGPAPDVAAPPLAGGSGAAFSQWEAFRGGPDVLVAACVATPIPGWVEDMRPAVEARTAGLMNASAERILGGLVEARRESPNEPPALPDTGRSFVLHRRGAEGDTGDLGTARTFVGWQDQAVVTCFALCAGPGGPTGATDAGARTRPCDATVAGARLAGTTAPPPPGVALEAVTWAVHHPSATVSWAGVLVVTMGVALVLGRRRPRSRI